MPDSLIPIPRAVRFGCWGLGNVTLRQISRRSLAAHRFKGLERSCLHCIPFDSPAMSSETHEINVLSPRKHEPSAHEARRGENKIQRNELRSLRHLLYSIRVYSATTGPRLCGLLGEEGGQWLHSALVHRLQLLLRGR